MDICYSTGLYKLNTVTLFSSCQCQNNFYCDLKEKSNIEKEKYLFIQITSIWKLISRKELTSMNLLPILILHLVTLLSDPNAKATYLNIRQEHLVNSVFGRRAFASSLVPGDKLACNTWGEYLLCLRVDHASANSSKPWWTEPTMDL